MTERHDNNGNSSGDGGDAAGAARVAGEVIVRRSARGLLLHKGELVLIRRTRPERPPYFVTPGGKVEGTDSSVEAALRREVREEIGGTIGDPVQVLLLTDQIGISDDGVRLVGVQHFLVAQLLECDWSARSGPEFTGLPRDRAARGAYDLAFAPLQSGWFAANDLKPPELAAYLTANLSAVIAETGPHHASTSPAPHGVGHSGPRPVV
ncbi:NUDIX domain-containing protein [Actinomadura harenae]|uniref:NUDIX domain-containing protein n=1 Tax=Actinomadura harenae TaxID=2483351 RepID=A0A3M2LSB1_9ACTN|nr:NUDIX domain-containing protein [Actinomadura harenae]RMI39976.1 NUDIX domain-containing protein [Actinomadura harenae]